MEKSEFPIIKKLGGKREFYAVMRSRGHGCSPGAVWHWYRAGQVPGTVILHVMDEADRRGIRYSAKDFRCQRRE